MLDNTCSASATVTSQMTFALAQGSSLLLTDQIDRLRDAARTVRRNAPFHVDAWVVLPDHMHCVWTLPANDADFQGRWAAIRRSFGRGMTGIRWQRAALPRTLNGVVDYADAVRMCWFAPVQLGLVRRPEDWEFSSIHREDCIAALAA